MWSEPVTLGGGMTIVHGVASGRVGRNSPSPSQCAYQRSSIARGSKVLGSSVMRRALSRQRCSDAQRSCSIKPSLGHGPQPPLVGCGLPAGRPAAAPRAPPQHRPIQPNTSSIPLHRVLRLQHPVVLVREDQQPRRDVAALERGEGGDALRVGDAEVLLAGDDQLRRPPVLDVIDRVPFLELGRRLVISVAAMLPFVEPQLLGLVGHGAGVEHAVMLDDALEPVGPLAPRSSSSCSRRRSRRARRRWRHRAADLGGRVGEAELQVLERPPPQLLVDRVGEGLAVTGLTRGNRR